MSFHWCDNLHTAVFSPRDYQVELLAAAFEANTMICLGHKSSKEFIALKLMQELGRSSAVLNSKISIYLSSKRAPAMFTMLQHLTDLRVYQETEIPCNINELPQGYSVYILHPKTCFVLLQQKQLLLESVNLLVLEDCHQTHVHGIVTDIFRLYYKTTNLANMPKVLGLAGPLHSAGCALSELSAMLNALEQTVYCRTETASDIVTVLRYCAKPFEYIVQCAPFQLDELCLLLQDILTTRKAFLYDHRYDPFEIYCTDEYIDELKDIPDPKKEPLEFLDTMLHVLREMGPWSANRVAFSMYQRIEKQKIKTPHERHYILLCLVNTALLEIHAICEHNFRKLKITPKECVEAYSSPKVRRLLEVLRLFKPEDNSSKNDTMKRISTELDQMDFQKLSRVLETKCHSVEQAVEKQQLESRSIVENLDSIVKPDFPVRCKESTLNKQQSKESENDNINESNIKKTEDTCNAVSTNTTNARRGGAPHNHHHNNRMKKRPYHRRHNRHDYDAADTLCSIIFCNSNYTARILFELLAEMTRHDPDLKFIKCQFTCDRVADPLTEPKEAESEHRRQEEVLKRFRMHDCNVLIGTSVLEEGIDVPKCNLVIRWDPPTTYRSYVQCKGRARAVPAYHVMLVAPSYNNDVDCANSMSEELTDKSHRMLCQLDDSFSDSEESDEDNGDETHINGVSTKQKFVYGCSKGTIKILNPEVITNKHPSSKPCTTSAEIVLKEIKDEPLPIEGSSTENVNKLTSTNLENSENIVMKSKVKDTSSLKCQTGDSNTSSDFNSSVIETNESFTIMDMSDMLEQAECKNKNKMCSPLQDTSNMKSKHTNPAEETECEQKNEISSLLQDTSSSESQLSNSTEDENKNESLENVTDFNISVIETNDSYSVMDLSNLLEPRECKNDNIMCSSLNDTSSSEAQLSDSTKENDWKNKNDISFSLQNTSNSEPQLSNSTKEQIKNEILNSVTYSNVSVLEANDSYTVMDLSNLLEPKECKNESNLTSSSTSEAPLSSSPKEKECKNINEISWSLIDTSTSAQQLMHSTEENIKHQILKKPNDSKAPEINESYTVMAESKNEVSNSSQATSDPASLPSNSAANTDGKNKNKMICLLQNTDDSESLLSNSVDEKNKHDIIEKTTNAIVKQMAEYREIENMLLQRCANPEPAENEHKEADTFSSCIKPYKPLPRLLTGASVDLTNSIALINKYCAKLPSDTFTKLTPLWRCARTKRNNTVMYQYTLRLPINSPLKYDIVGLPMPTHVLARRVAALEACIALHKSRELDDNLQPIGKEGFKAIEADWENFELEDQDEKIVQENSEPRPGTTKRRQYYYKRIASEFCDCRPTVGEPCYLYLLDLTLQCPIPEEQNTRGRKIYPPEDALQGFGILTLKKIPKVSSFPIFTRSGEVKVSLVLHPQRVVLTAKQISCINTFINYTFTKVLRLKKFLMLFDPESTENCVFIVPTLKTADGCGKTIDWEFLDLIERNANMMPTPVAEEDRHATEFCADKFKDAVVMPWYRNQDQPHYFYVAEICQKLSPLSLFPSTKYKTFMHYYYLKYGLKIHPKQPLLDVDHTSARLNFLTPRYVNRKGVALPTSSEATKRAKRENLELKQILVPELCTVHPFPASLWRTAVCLPCILYRINGLLLADDIRKKVVKDMGLGQPELAEDKEWPMLDFGWSLSDVLKKSKANKQKGLEDPQQSEAKKDVLQAAATSQKNNTAEYTDAVSDQPDTERTLNEIVEDAERVLQEKSGWFVEIGTWSNDLAYREINDDDEDSEVDELLSEILPPSIKLCGKVTHATSPTFRDVQLENEEIKTTNPTFNCYDSDESYDDSSFVSDDEMVDESTESDIDEDDIVLTAKNEAETIETEEDIEKLNKQLSIIQATKENERHYQETKNLQVGFDFGEVKEHIADQLKHSVEKFQQSTQRLMESIKCSETLVKYNQTMKLPDKVNEVRKNTKSLELCIETYKRLVPYITEMELKAVLGGMDITQPLDIERLKVFNSMWLKQHPKELYLVEGSGDIFDSFNDSENMIISEDGTKSIEIDFDGQGREYRSESEKCKKSSTHSECYTAANFSFDYQPDLNTHPGPSPSIILQALTMSNANDGINLERLETIGDSFLKYAITTYLYITYENVHEGKLSHLRSKQVANLNLYRLGRRKVLGEYMIATKFEPSDNWLPPCYYVPKELEKALIEAKIPPHYWRLVDLVNIKKLTNAEICDLVREKAEEWGVNLSDGEDDNDCKMEREWDNQDVPYEFSCFIPYNLVSQHSIPDKSVADCVEALIGAYLIECGLRGALLFMAWLGIRVIPYERMAYDSNKPRLPGSTLPDAEGMITIYGSWSPPKSPLLHFTPNAERKLNAILTGYDNFEQILGYKFRDRSYLLQAMTHASYTPNRLTDCYQRLEFLGDAVLDYLITRHLYEDPRQHSPGALTDLRSALVNNTIFASLAVRHGFHKYFRHLSPGLNEVIDRFVRIQTENGHSISEEYYLLSEEECDDAEDVEVPKALGDVFESVAGAIFLDSSMSLDAVWHVYYNMMRPEIEQFSNSVPKSPIRELLELEPETAKFGKPEKLADGRRVRVTVEVFCKGTYRGIGRNYRIAKCTAAKCALRQLKKKGLIEKRC